MKRNKPKKKLSQPVYLNFLSKGLACHALCLLEYVGVCKLLEKKGSLSEEKILSFGSSPLLKATLVTLVEAKVLSVVDDFYQFTRLGKNLHKHIGAIFMPLVGYRNLFAKQFELVFNSAGRGPLDIDYSTVANSSVDFGVADLDPQLLEVLQQLQPKGTICDLGCGTGEKLAKFCKETHSRGLGIERAAEIVKKGLQLNRKLRTIEIIESDITNLDIIREDVDIAMMTMVYHDITPEKKALNFLRSVRIHFPCLRYLIIADIVSPSKAHPSSLPGFDYVHGLQGIIPRNYEQSIETFRKANFMILKEVAVPNIPNMFIWVLASNLKKH